MNQTKFWQAKPFPHLVIDDFLPVKEYEAILAKTLSVSSKPYATFGTKVEAGKATFESESELGQALSPIVTELTAPHFLDRLSVLTGAEARPLTEYKQSSDYKYYHQMYDGGVLGSHVDHSQFYRKDGTIVDDKVHFLNCIFYVTKHDFCIGGNTLLHGPKGTGLSLEYVTPVPNRLLIFLHTSQSFHGVSPLTLWNQPRTTVYMDYYCKPEWIDDLRENACKNDSTFVPRFWKHRTTFVPRMDIRSLIKYGPWYAEWMMRRKLKAPSCS